MLIFNTLAQFFLASKGLLKNYSVFANLPPLQQFGLFVNCCPIAKGGRRHPALLFRRIDLTVHMEFHWPVQMVVTGCALTNFRDIQPNPGMLPVSDGAARHSGYRQLRHNPHWIDWADIRFDLPQTTAGKAGRNIQLQVSNGGKAAAMRN